MGNAYRRGDSGYQTFVAQIKLCKAVPFYGYHVGWQRFLRIYLLNPTYTLKCADLLLNGKVMGLSMQPYESHIPYLLAFLADFHLYGCGWLEFDLYTSRPENSRKKIALTQREFDIDSGAINNRYRLFQASLHESFDAEHRLDEIGTRVQSLKELRLQDNKRRLDMGIEPYSKPFQSSMARVPDDSWERSEEWLERLQARLRDSVETWNGDLTFSSFMSSTQGTQDLSQVPTMFELNGSSAKNAVDGLGPEFANTFRLVRKQTSTERAMSVGLSPVPAAKKSREASQFNDEELLMLSFSSISTVEYSNQAETAQSQLRSQPQVNESLLSSIMEHYDFGKDSALLQTPSPSSNEVSMAAGSASYPQPIYSNPDDVSLFPFNYGGKEYNVKSQKVSQLPMFKFADNLPFNLLSVHLQQEKLEGRPTTTGKLQFMTQPPSYNEVLRWHQEHTTSQTNTTQFVLPSLDPVEPSDEMSILAAEVYVNSRPRMTPIASDDPITAIFWHAVCTHGPGIDKPQKGVITVDEFPKSSNFHVTVVDSETELLDCVLSLVRQYDPDILVGYEVVSSSWGYISARYQTLTGEKMDLGRIDDENTVKELPFNMTIASRGRHIFNLWSILRKEVALLKYTLEYVVLQTFHETTPHLTFDSLTKLWGSSDAGKLNVQNYMMTRLSYTLKIMDNLEIVTKYVEHSRIIGIDFYSSLTRGSQYQVEAVLCRMAKRENFIMVSPSRKQVGQQNALEYIPLILEPKSALYTNPVCVLDFRSLYPSMVIAYNLCYSTCLGRVDLWKGRNKLGINADFQLPAGLLKLLENDIYIAPNGICYVKANKRKSLLAQMLQEFLSTRFMVKDSMKLKRDNARYQRNLNSQQLALKFIANVTYGYTSASFSGRMPCGEIADSIVSTGRETLTKAIKMIESAEKWGLTPKVVYGDTDSLFVELPGATRSQAFLIGREIADMVTAANPDPVELELEKVYHPCFLLTKKRYVGESYESATTAKPFFDAKGTETVRRDGTPIEQKIEKRALQILFKENDLSKVKSYLQNQWRNILNGRVPIQDFCFAQEVKLGHYSENATTAQLPGGAVVSLAKMAKDIGGGPQYKERVPFVITAGPSGSKIAERCVSPEDMMRNSGLIVDAEYYITKNIIPPLERFLNLVGVNVKTWYADMPRTVRFFQQKGNGDTLRHYLKTQTCAVCLDKCDTYVCAKCKSKVPRSHYILQSRLNIQERKVIDTHQACRSCSGSTLGSLCVSLDCSMYYERENAASELQSIQEITANALGELDEVS